MNKKRYFQSPHIWLLPADTDTPVCTLQQGSREYDGSMDVDVKQRIDQDEDLESARWGTLW